MAVCNEKPATMELPIFPDRRGNLSFIEGQRHIPFEIAGSYWIYDMVDGAPRAASVFRQRAEFIVALSGSFEVVSDDGQERHAHSLNRPSHGLYVPCGCEWLLKNPSANALALVLVSEPCEPEAGKEGQ